MDWYNRGVKEEFINRYTSTVGEYTFNAIFSKSAVIERELDKDCSCFSLPEIMDLARSFRSADISSVRFKISLLNSYAHFCINSGMSDTGLNHYSEVTEAMYESLVDKRKMAQTYISRKEVEDILTYFENPRDKYVILAPYEGVYGEGLCELLKLGKKDLLKENTVRLCTGRKLVVSPLLYNVMEDAAETYTAFYNGKERRLEKTDLVYKPIELESVKKTDDRAIKRKFTKLKRYLDRDTFGVRMLYVSGFLNEIDKLVSKYGGFEEARHMFDTVQDRYQSKYTLGTIRKMYKEMKLVENL